ncbi:J domain-containing protein [Cupriavidus gilardii]|uniref:J domain-containing protein n=1 Tax=Cupriavidus gilardii TaxID=82541 RepID=UPI001573A904|nr:J domain-containing protein [Cupriavidus gilardii]NSX05461.1 J domain-containing protein [Cupriavidus gilardii]
MSSLSAIPAQRPIDMPSAVPHAKSSGERCSTPPQDAAVALLMSLVLANLNANAFASRTSAPLSINTIVLVDHAGRLSAAVVVLWPVRGPEPEPERRDDRQSERTRQQRNRPERARGTPPHRPTARINPYAPDGWSFDRLPHEILGLNAGETDMAKIARAFRAASLKAHPDKGGRPEQMQAVAAARDFMKAQAEQPNAGSAAH